MSERKSGARGGLEAAEAAGRAGHAPEDNSSAGDSGVVRLRIELAYDGAPFDGWARQPARPTVQGALEDALHLVLRVPVRTVVAGRTDAGVHARVQTVHADVPGPAWAALARADDEAPGARLARRLNGALRRVLGKDRQDRGLPAAIGAVVVRDAQRAPDGFDARFSALSRGYTYRVADAVTGHDPLTRGFAWWVDGALDVTAMNRALAQLVGLHDFLSFCKPREGATTVRQLQTATVQRGPDGMLTFTVRADAFCHHMVRSLVGSAVRVGQGRYDAAWLRERLDARVRDARVLIAPAHGLVLDAVDYPAEDQLAARAVATRAQRPSV